MVLGRFLRRGEDSNGASLADDLKRVTDSNLIEVPPALMGAVIEASQKGEEERRAIMTHVRECLAEPLGKKWRRIYAGLLLMEELLKNGSAELVSETAEGRHFDLAMRLTLLGKFECTNDKRVQNMVRTKATSLRAEFLPRLEMAGCSEVGDGASSSGYASSKPAVSTASAVTNPNPLMSISSFSTSASTFNGSDEPEKPKGQMILNGVVRVGHTDDTTSESSGNEGHKAVAYRQPARKSTRERNHQGRSAIKEDELAPPPPPATAQSMDLLNL